MTRRIAAIVTCRDLGRTLPEALRGLEVQTRPPAEIVVVDDASTDLYTRQVIARIEREGTCVVHGDGRGASAARNLGIRLTSSDYLVCLDADDVLEADYFAAAAARLDADPDLDFVSCAMRAFGEAEYVWKPTALTFVEAAATGAVPHASTMMRRRLWDAAGGFDETLQSFELLDFWATVFERGSRGVVLDEPLLRYRVRPQSGYRRSIQAETYISRLNHFYDKHRDSIDHCAPELILAKETFLVGQREYHRALEARRTSLDRELAELQEAIAQATAELAQHGHARVNWGDLNRTAPISAQWGRDRGTPIDRHYIERFLSAHRADIRGRVLEVRDSTYTRRFGGDAVASADVVDVDPANGAATIVADLRRAEAIPRETFDCIILTQTLQLVDDIAAAVRECARLLRPGGVLLATAPNIIRVDDERGPDGDYWRLTEASARRVFADVFPVDAFEVETYGNVMACAAFLYGMSVEEMSAADLDRLDANYPMVVAVRAVKPASCSNRRADAGRAASRRAVILAYHRIAELSPDSHRLCLAPAEFRRQMAFLAREFTPIALDDLLRAAAAGRIPDRAVAVTLDDGYLDALTTATPILMDEQVPATFFVNTDRLDAPHERWWDTLERVFSPDAALPDRLTMTVDGRDVTVDTRTIEERRAAVELLNRAAWPLGAAARAALIDHVVAWSGLDAAPRDSHRVMTGDEIRELACRPGQSIGAHSTHHLALPRQTVDVRREEIAGCKRALEALLERPIGLFSYPYGEVDGATIAAVAEAGFHGAVTVEAGFVSAGGHRLLLPRCEVTAGDPAAFEARLREAFDGCLLSR